MIEVTRDRFNEIFKESKYKEERVKLPPGDWSSEHEFLVTNSETGELVGKRLESSWGYWYWVLDKNLISVGDLLHILRKEFDELKREVKQLRKDLNRKPLTWWQRLKKWFKERNRGPGLFEFLEGKNDVPYTPPAKEKISEIIKRVNKVWNEEF